MTYLLGNSQPVKTWFLLKVANSDGKAKKGSQKWIQKLINENASIINAPLKQNLNLSQDEKIDWISPLEKDKYTEYYDEVFLEKLGLSALIPELKKFWPKGGPHWDCIGQSSSQKVFLVEAKSHISELISSLRATNPYSKRRIEDNLRRTKRSSGQKQTSIGPRPSTNMRIGWLMFISSGKKGCLHTSLRFIS